MYLERLTAIKNMLYLLHSSLKFKWSCFSPALKNVVGNRKRNLRHVSPRHVYWPRAHVSAIQLSLVSPFWAWTNEIHRWNVHSLHCVEAVRQNQGGTCVQNDCSRDQDHLKYENKLIVIIKWATVGLSSDDLMFPGYRY